MNNDTISCEGCGEPLSQYQYDDDLGWCSVCYEWRSECGDERAWHQCCSCNDDLDHDHLHRPDPDGDDECGTCYRDNHPSLTAAERNQ